MQHCKPDITAPVIECMSSIFLNFTHAVPMEALAHISYMRPLVWPRKASKDPVVGEVEDAAADDEIYQEHSG